MECLYVFTLLHFLQAKCLCTTHCLLQGRNKNVAITAWTGTAAELLSGDRILHNLVKLPVPILDTSKCKISPRSPQAAMLRDLHLTTTDEASTTAVHALHAIDLLVCEVMNNDHPFSGKIKLCLEETFVKFSQWCGMPFQQQVLKQT